MKFVKFSQILDFQKKSKMKAGEGLSGGTFPFFTSSPTLSKYTEFSQFKLPSIIFGTGGSASIHVCEKPFSVSTDCLVAQIKPERSKEFVIRFIYYYLFKNIWILEKGFKGAGLRHISKSYIENIPIPELPIEDQKRIIKILDAADALRQKRKQAITLLDDYLKSVFLEMFGDLFKNEKKWKFFEFENYVTLLTDYHANGSYEVLRDNVKLFLEPNHAIMVRTTDLENNNYTNDVNYIDEHAYNFLSKSKVFGGEIIINKIGSAGKIYLMPKLNRPVSLGMNAFLLRFKDGVNVNFIYYLLTSAYGKAIIQKKVKGAVTKTIRKDAVRSLLVPEISPDLQNKFSVIFEKTESIKQKMLIQSEELETGFQALMQKAFKGEL